MKTKQNPMLRWCVLALFFPCALGIFAMANHDISAMIWMQNPLFIALLAAVCFFVRKRNLRLTLSPMLLILASTLLLCATFFYPSADNVHRWIRIPFFSLQVSVIVLPVLLVCVDRLLEQKQWAAALAGILFPSAVLFFQPDAAQLSAFSFAVVALLFLSTPPKALKYGLSLALGMLSLAAWLHLDSLAPVNYAEGVLMMLLDQSVLLYAAGLLSLFFMPVPFLIASLKYNRKIGIAAAVYYWVMLACALTGHFPIPFMGYGLSPILGYFLFLAKFPHSCQ